jgi:transposase
MTSKRKRYSADFKAKVALEALRGELTTAQLAAKHGIHHTMVGEWKKQALEGLTRISHTHYDSCTIASRSIALSN